jgi:hypothetical protein
MLRSNLIQQNAYELICIEELVPSDHLLRRAHTGYNPVRSQRSPDYRHHNMPGKQGQPEISG